MAQGKASCTGLSIVLSDACRAVCVPARLVGTPMWSNKRAITPGSRSGIRTALHRRMRARPQRSRSRLVCRRCRPGQKRNTSRVPSTPLVLRDPIKHFPLVWAMRNKDVPGENVTDRYAKKAAPKAGHSSRTHPRLRCEQEACRHRRGGGGSRRSKKIQAMGNRVARRPTRTTSSPSDLTPGREYTVKAGNCGEDDQDRRGRRAKLPSISTFPPSRRLVPVHKDLSNS